MRYLRSFAAATTVAALAGGAIPAAMPTTLRAQDRPGGGVSLSPDPSQPPNRQGSRGANFLQIGIGARGNAMAGAVASIIDGPTALYWNPAGIAASEQFSVGASRQMLYEGLDIAQNFIAVTMPVLGGVAGASFNSLSSGDIERTVEGLPEGDPVVGTTYNWNSTAIGLSYARRLTDRLDVGATGKYVSDGMTDAKLSWFALDMGTQFRTGLYGLVVGASLQNVGASARATGSRVRATVNAPDFSEQLTRVDLFTRETELPTLFRFSIGSDLYGRAASLLGAGNGQHTLSLDVNFSDAIDTDLQTAFGGEYGFRNIVFARAGKRFYNDERAVSGTRGMFGLAGGLGLRLPTRGRAMRFDYSYTSLGELGGTQVFSFEFGK